MNHQLTNNRLITLALHATKVPILELELLLAHVLNKDRIYFKLYPENLLLPKEVMRFNKLLNRRLQGEPIAYIINNKNFWDLNLIVNHDVLIPRPETELLVEKSLEIIEYELAIQSKQHIKILELGTGSGALSLAIAKTYPTEIEITATDISIDALKIAKLNAKYLDIKNINFLCGDWFKALSKRSFFDLIISNPPYIAFEEIHLCDNEIFFEPKIALFANNFGLSCLEHIIVNSKNYLTHCGTLLVEHGIFQKNKVFNFFANANFKSIKSHKDFSGINRIMIGK